jgi:triacylglycerol lipase
VAFDPVFTRDVALPLAQAAYTVMGANPATLPAGYRQTSLIQADPVVLTAMTDPHPVVTAMTKNTNIFGLMLAWRHSLAAYRQGLSALITTQQ